MGIDGACKQMGKDAKWTMHKGGQGQGLWLAGEGPYSSLDARPPARVCKGMKEAFNENRERMTKANGQRLSQ